MLNIGFEELLVIIVLAIIVVGPDDIPRVLRELGKQYGKIARASEELRRAFLLEADRGEAEARAEALRKRREEARQRAEDARARIAASRVNGGTGIPVAAEDEELSSVPRQRGPAEPPPVADDPAQGIAAMTEAAGVAPEQRPPAPQTPPDAGVP